MSKSHKGRPQYAAGRAAASDVEKELIRLPALNLDELRREWKLEFKVDPPLVRSRDILLRLLAWQMQSDTLGDLDADTERKLRNITKALERDGDYEPKIRRNLSSGVVLTREWKGVIHKVTATADGFQHLGKRYGSLSDVARTITGTRWSGPRFFGLEQRKRRQSQEPQPVSTSSSIATEPA